MAQGCIDAFKKLGIRVPEYVKVIGFDNSSLSYISNNKISTINQNIVGQGYYAAELAMKVLNKEKLDKVLKEFDNVKDFIFEKQSSIEKLNSEITLLHEKITNNTNNFSNNLTFKRK